MTRQQTIVAFSHLRWDFVYQRPQHLMSRFARTGRVLFIEEPSYKSISMPTWNLSEPAPNITVACLHTPDGAPGFHADHLPVFHEMIPELLARKHIDEFVAWLYTPLALPIVESLAPQAIVYDCMDELSAFLSAPRALLAQEQALLNTADLVFTGGPSLYRAKRDRHPNVYCFPSSVEAEHFRQARDSLLEEPHDQRALPHPRLGFYGVIDERVDIPLLTALADAHPEWQLVMVGPVAKINRAHLPQRPNILYTGQRSYAELPAYLAGWDVCLLPFARNESTRFISPTKTLEYMAAERPIVSTPITDVADPYGDIVYLGDTPETFIAACEQALASNADERAERFTKMRTVLAKTSWDSTAAAMRCLIERTVAEKQASLTTCRAAQRIA